MNKFSETLMYEASKVDKITNSCGEITKLAALIVEEKNHEATKILLHRFSELLELFKNNKEVKVCLQKMNNSLIDFYGYATLKEICGNVSDSSDDNKTLHELLEDLNKLVGLEKVKAKVQDLIIFQKVQLMRRE